MARTYATFEEFGQALNRAYRGLNPAVETALRINVKDLVSNIKLRVSTKGQKADGNSFSTPYSKSHTYKRRKYGQGALGKQTSYKGFFYQGDMWNNFRMLTLNARQDGMTATLGFEGQNAYISNESLNQIHSTREQIAIAAASPDEARDLTRKIGFAIGEYLNATL